MASKNELQNGASINSNYVLGAQFFTSFDDLSWSSHYDHMSAKAYKALGFIRRTITASASVSIKKALFISLVRSHLTFCSQIWRPYLLKDMRHLEQIQRRASKFILNDFTSDYKLRLINLNLLPLTMWFELQDIMFLMKAIKFPSENFKIKDIITFSSSNTRASAHNKLQRNPLCKSRKAKQFYFNRISRLWNALPPVDLSLSLCTLEKQMKCCSGVTSHYTLIQTLPVHGTLSAPVQHAALYPHLT